MELNSYLKTCILFFLRNTNTKNFSLKNVSRHTLVLKIFVDTNMIM